MYWVGWACRACSAGMVDGLAGWAGLSWLGWLGSLLVPSTEIARQCVVSSNGFQKLVQTQYVNTFKTTIILYVTYIN